MNTELQLRYSYRMEGHFAVGGVDTGFYRNLPNVQEEYVNPETGTPQTNNGMHRPPDSMSLKMLPSVGVGCCSRAAGDVLDLFSYAR